MTNRKNNTTYIAQKKYNDATAWRSVPNQIYTSSNLANITLKELEEQQKNVEPVVTFDASKSADYYNSINEGLDGVIGTIQTNAINRELTTVEQCLIDLKPALDLFERSLKSSKSSFEPELFNRAVDEFRQIRDLEKKARSAKVSDLNVFSNIVKDQVSQIANTVGGAGRKLANDVVSDYLKDSQGSGLDTLELLVQEIKKFLSDGSIGKLLLEQAEPLISAPQEILRTAILEFEDCAIPASAQAQAALTPVFSSLNNIVRALPGNIGGELKNITQQIRGFTSVVDRGLSATRTDGSQLQPLAGRYGTRPSVNSQTARLPRGLENQSPIFQTTGFSGGTIDFYPSGYVGKNYNHARRTSTQFKTVSDKFTTIATELNNLRVSVLKSYQKMPGDAIKNPEAANGPSLTTPINEPLSLNMIDNNKRGTTVADISGTLQTDDQVFQPRIG